MDGLLNLDEFAEQTGVSLPEGPYETVAGYVLAMLGELPEVGAEVEVNGHRLTVTKLDGRRIARVRVGEVGGGGSAPDEKAPSPAAGDKATGPALDEKAAAPPPGENTATPPPGENAAVPPPGERAPSPAPGERRR